MKKGKNSRSLLLLIPLIWTNAIWAQQPGPQQDLTWEEVLESEQIPYPILGSMPTEDLLQAYLNSRYPGYLWLHNRAQDGFARAYNDFNGLRELLERDDAGQVLMTHYQAIDPTAYDLNWEPVRQGRYAVQFVYLELLLSDERTLRKLSLAEKKSLLAELLEKQKQKAEELS